MQINTQALESRAVDMKNLSTNYIDVATGACDCAFDDAVAKNELINTFPLVSRLLATQASRVMRGRFDLNHVTQTDISKWTLRLPTMVWTTAPKNTGEDCCFESYDFDKCCGEVPLNILCLKDCNSTLDEFIKRDVKVTNRQALDGIANAGESAKAVETRIAKLSFAFFQAYTALLGLENTYTDVTKPFHSLLSVMENEAVTKLYCTDILSTFDQWGCRADFLGAGADYFIAVNPITYRSIDRAVFKGQDGEYPSGWTKNPLTFHGVPFVADFHVPVDMTTGTGEAWIVDGRTTGLFMATDLFVGNEYIKESGIDTSVDSCGASCTYYFNYGAAFNTDASKLAMIVDIPLDTACLNVLGDLGGLITPNTLIPGGDVETTSI